MAEGSQSDVPFIAVDLNKISETGGIGNGLISQCSTQPTEDFAKKESFLRDGLPSHNFFS